MKKFFFRYILIFSIIFPVINFHFSHFGVELILFGLSLLIWSLFYKQTYIKQSVDRGNYITLGIVVSIKLNSIILEMYFFILFFLTKYIKI